MGGELLPLPYSLGKANIIIVQEIKYFPIHICMLVNNSFVSFLIIRVQRVEIYLIQT